MQELIAATGNPHKIEEINAVTRLLGIRVLSPAEAGLTMPEVEENGETFAENARVKAKSLTAISGRPCISDDSGIAVDALHGAPGIYSARFSGEDATDEKNLFRLLHLMEHVPEGKRGAQFVCAICVCYPDGTLIETQGVCKGRLLHAPVGDGGFGYDPIFVPEEYEATGLSFAQVPAEEKNKISHRRRALEALAQKLKERGGL